MVKGRDGFCPTFFRSEFGAVAAARHSQPTKTMRTMIVPATRNAGKLREIRALLKDYAVDLRGLAGYGTISTVGTDEIFGY